jgi:excisionase family DNA binding protein
LTTTAAAALLHCSRQHVVDLCDNGTLPFVRAGTHRRIRRDDVERRLLRPPFRREVDKSLWLHRAVAGKLVADPVRGMALARRKLRYAYTGTQKVDRVLDGTVRQTAASVEVTPGHSRLRPGESTSMLLAGRVDWGPNTVPAFFWCG